MFRPLGFFFFFFFLGFVFDVWVGLLWSFGGGSGVV